MKFQRFSVIVNVIYFTFHYNWFVLTSQFCNVYMIFCCTTYQFISVPAQVEVGAFCVLLVGLLIEF